MKLAYSYIRFSSQKQELGDSLRRQLALSEAYAGTHGLVLDTSTYRDLGVSAFDRTNLEKGALAAFLEAVRNGAVPRGSYLLVENLDRLSRAYVHTALRLLTDLVEAGITVVTLTDEKVWDSESIKDVTSLLLSVLIFHRAHDESQQKSRRLQAAWSKKREEAYAGQLPTSEVPRWLRVLPGRSGVEVIPELVDSIEKVFGMTKAGFGATAITRRANTEGWPAPSTSGKWHLSLIHRLLANRALLGEFQPHVVRDGKRVPIGDPIRLFPQVISQEQWDSARLSQQLRKEMPRRRDAQYKNIFHGFLFCGNCGASLVRKQKSANDRPSGYNKAGYTRYYCADRVLGVTECPSCSDGLIEGALLAHILSLAGGYLSQTDDMAKQLSADVDRQMALFEGYGIQIGHLAEAIAQTGPLPALLERLTKAQADHANAKRQLDDSQARLNAISVAAGSDGELEKLGDIMNSPDPTGRAELREKLLRLVTGIWLWPDKELAGIEWRATGNVVGVILGAPKADSLGALMTLKKPERQSGRLKRKGDKA